MAETRLALIALSKNMTHLSDKKIEKADVVDSWGKAPDMFYSKKKKSQEGCPPIIRCPPI